MGNGIHGHAAKALPITHDTARKLRVDTGLSSAGLGRLVGASGTAVGLWEEGRHAPVGGNRQRYVRALHAAAGFLLELNGGAEYAAARELLAADMRTELTSV